MTWCGMVWRGTDRVVGLGGAWSWQGPAPCPAPRRGAAGVVANKLAPLLCTVVSTRIISPPRVVLCRPKNTELKNTAAKAPASPLQSNTGGAGVKKGERLGE